MTTGNHPESPALCVCVSMTFDQSFCADKGTWPRANVTMNTSAAPRLHQLPHSDSLVVHSASMRMIQGFISCLTAGSAVPSSSSLCCSEECGLSCSLDTGGNSRKWGVSGPGEASSSGGTSNLEGASDPGGNPSSGGTSLGGNPNPGDPNPGGNPSPGGNLSQGSKPSPGGEGSPISGSKSIQGEHPSPGEGPHPGEGPSPGRNPRKGGVSVLDAEDKSSSGGT